MLTRATPRTLSLEQLPNGLTIVRFLLVPIFVALVLTADEGHSWPAAIVFAAAGVTDQVDGWLARRWRVESAFGRVADPLADRLMIDAAIATLWLEGRLPWQALFLILLRDGILVAGYKLLAPRGYDVEVNFLGKVATWILYAALTFILATPDGTDWPLWLFWGGLALAVVAGVDYVWRTVRRRRA